MKDLFVRHSYLAMTQGRILKRIERMNERVNNIESSIGMFYLQLSKVLYISFDRFLLAVESRDLSQTDKSVIRVSSFSILHNFNFLTIKLTVILKTTI